MNSDTVAPIGVPFPATWTDRLGNTSTLPDAASLARLLLTCDHVMTSHVDIVIPGAERPVHAPHCINCGMATVAGPGLIYPYGRGVQ